MTPFSSRRSLNQTQLHRRLRLGRPLHEERPRKTTHEPFWRQVGWPRRRRRRREGGRECAELESWRSSGHQAHVVDMSELRAVLDGEGGALSENVDDRVESYWYVNPVLKRRGGHREGFRGLMAEIGLNSALTNDVL